MECSECRYWRPIAGEVADGICRRYAPRPNEYTTVAKWPRVRPGAWCGEWEADE